MAHVMVKAIHIDRNGIENPCEMTLRSYVQVAKVQPGRWKPADDKSEALIAKVPAAAVPIGTTQEDVEKFEKNKGKVKGKKQASFDRLMDSIARGEDVVDVDNDEDEGLDLTIQPEPPEGPKADAVIIPDPDSEEDLGEENQDAPPDKKEIVEVSGPSQSKLAKMSDDKLNAVISALPIAPKMQDALTKLKTKKEKIKQILKVTAK